MKIVFINFESFKLCQKYIMSDDIANIILNNDRKTIANMVKVSNPEWEKQGFYISMFYEFSHPDDNKLILRLERVDTSKEKK